MAKADVIQEAEELKARLAQLKEDTKENHMDNEVKTEVRDTEQAMPETVHIRKGEDPLTSRPYMYSRALRALVFKDWSEAKVEREVHERLSQLVPPTSPETLLVPLSTRAMGEESDTAGGYLVTPEQANEIIELLRSNVVVEAAGARVVILPKSGQLDIPRQTGKATYYWLGEGATITASDLSFGTLQLRAKKLAAFVVVSNELLADATPDVEEVIRRDLAESLAEAEDIAYLQGSGAGGEPLGIINTPGITTYTLTNDSGDGASLVADDIYGMMEALESAKGNVNRAAWIMAPRTKYSLLRLKDNDGRFLWQPSLQEGTPSVLAGIPVYVSHQIPVNLTKGANNDCSYIILGEFGNAYIGRHQVLEIDVSKEFGFQTYQTAIRAVARVDFGLRQPATFVYADGVRA